MHGTILPGKSPRHDEQGYLLVGAGILILIIVALLSSYSFVIKRDFSYKANYAAGERFAEIVAAAHFYAQQQVYGSSGTGTVQPNCNLLSEMNLPIGTTINPINGATFEIKICGANAAPVNTVPPPVNPAASAYVLLKIRGMPRSPGDTVAFLAGAAAHGMDRVGVIGSNAGGLCNGLPNGAITRWGPDPSACMTSNLMTVSLGFVDGGGLPDAQNGDIIVPAWETALSQNEMAVIYRYPQPERPDMNAMNTDLLFAPSTIAGAVDCNDPAIHCLRDADTIVTRNISASGATTAGDNAADEFLVRQGSNAVLAATTVNGAPLRVYDQTGTAPFAMDVAGPVDLTGTTTSVGGTMSASGNFDLASPNPVYTNTLGAKTTIGQTPFDTQIALTPSGATPGSAAINNTTTSVITGVQVDGNMNSLGAIGNGRQRFTGNGGVSGTDMDIYAAEITMQNTPLGDPVARITNAGNNLDWTVGSIEQNGNFSNGQPNSPRFVVQDFYVNTDCIGRGCPSSVNQVPSGGF